jgi:hypothetical protein
MRAKIAPRLIKRASKTRRSWQMQDTDKFREENAELKRLEEEPVRAEINANAVLMRRGMNSLEFLEVNETVRDLVSRING